MEGVSKLTRIQYATKEDEQMENLRKMLIAMSKDIRVILIKISDRLHNMRTIGVPVPLPSRSRSPWKPWRSTPPSPTGWVCSG